jgi:fumarate hydratase, class II
MMTEYRIENDSMGVVKIPRDAYWGAQTQRAIANFPVSGITFPSVFIKSLALIKQASAVVNREYGALDRKQAEMIIRACQEAAEGAFAGQFPLDIFQTGSGTSTNMNMNEVIATRANELLTGAKHTTRPVHPNDHVNMGQSSNDVIPSAIHCAACLLSKEQLLPALDLLVDAIHEQQERCGHIVKTARTHLMDAVPVTFGQELSGWGSQIAHARIELTHALVRLQQLAIGGTAVGTGINTKTDFGMRVARKLAELTEIGFTEATNHFEAQSSMDAAAAFSGDLSAYASSLMKISNDLRLMNSGPFSGLGEIRLRSLQPGSSIMPGKVNPVIPESARMVCAQVIGNNAVITMANALGEFQLNVMLPVIAHNLLESITILASISNLLAEKAIRDYTVDEAHIAAVLHRNPIIATVLNPVIGYDKAASVVKKALEEKKSVQEAAVELGFMTEEEAGHLLDLRHMTEPGFSGNSE